jgi:hypothetical protein
MPTFDWRLLIVQLLALLSRALASRAMKSVFLPAAAARKGGLPSRP